MHLPKLDPNLYGLFAPSTVEIVYLLFICATGVLLGSCLAAACKGPAWITWPNGRNGDPKINHRSQPERYGFVLTAFVGSGITLAAAHGNNWDHTYLMLLATRHDSPVLGWFLTLVAFIPVVVFLASIVAPIRVLLTPPTVKRIDAITGRALEQMELRAARREEQTDRWFVSDKL